MAGRHALLIGIGSYGEGLAAIPSARADVEALAEVLLDPALGGLQPTCCGGAVGGRADAASTARVWRARPGGSLAKRD